jgi:hypothetical protein
MEQGRTKEQRKEDALKLLDNEIHIWLATSNGERDAHLVPMTFYWDGHQLTMGTFEQNKTARNLRRTGWARGALGTTRDVVIVEGTVTFTPVDAIDPPLRDGLKMRWTRPIDFHKLPGFVFFHLYPHRIQAYRPGFVENTNRTLMANSKWLV